MILWNLFGGFLANLIQNAMKELLEAISQIFGDAFYAAFYIEKMEGLSVLTSGAVEAALGNMYTILVYLLALKFLWKGVQVYILWRSGEAENPPTEMVKGAVLAMIVAAAFPLLYSYAVEITRSIGPAVKNLSVLLFHDFALSFLGSNLKNTISDMASSTHHMVNAGL